MRSILLQDWQTFRCTASPGARLEIIQSEPGWIRTDELQDAAFLIEVSYAVGEDLFLGIETAPVAEDRLFRPLQLNLIDLGAPGPVDLAALVGSSTVLTAFAHATTGPPLASYVRWHVADVSAWEACFRITMFAI